MKIFSLLRRKFKGMFDNIRNERLKNNFLQAIPFWVASLITGLIAVLYAKLFAYAEQGTAYMLLHFGWWLFIITPSCFLIAWWLVVQFSPYSRGSGIPQTKAALIAGGGYISLKTVIGKFFCCSLSLGGGIALHLKAFIATHQRDDEGEHRRLDQTHQLRGLCSVR